MKVERMIRLDELAERNVIKDAQRSIPIAFEEGKNLDEAWRKLGGLTSGDVVTAKRIGEAIDVLLEVSLAIREDIKHYERLRDDPPKMEKLPEGAIPVIANPQDMAHVIVESRQLQQIEVTEGLTLLRRAQRAVAA